MNCISAWRNTLHFRLFVIIKSALAVCFAGGVFIHAVAQNSSLSLEMFLPPSNASLNSMTCSMIGERGFLWFGTDGGLMRYDGSTIRSYPNDPGDSFSLGGTIITGMAQYGDSIMLCFRGDGLDVFDPITEHFSHYRADAPGPLASNFVKNLLVDSEKNIWLTYQQNSDLYCYRLDQGVLRKVDQISLENNAIYHAALFNEGILLATIGKGIIYHEPAKGRTHYFDSRNSGLISDDVYRLTVLNDSTIWVATSKSVQSLVLKDDKAISQKVVTTDIQWSLVNDMARDPGRDNLLWIATDHSGLFQLEMDDLHLLKAKQQSMQGSSELRLQSLMFDNSNVLWVGTDNSGVFKINTRNAQFNDWPDIELYNTAIGNNRVNCMMQDSKGLFWAATETDGLVATDFREKKVTRFFLEQNSSAVETSNSIRSIVEYNKDEVWIGTNGNGVYRIPDHRLPESLSKVDVPGLGSSLIRHMLVVKDNLWIATRDFLIRYNYYEKSSKAFTTADGLCSNRIRHLYADGNDNLWIGTDEGLSVMKLSTGKIHSFIHDPQNQKSISNNQIRSILTDSQGRIWIGTRGGLNQLNLSENTFTHYPFFLDFGVNSFYSISEADRYLWFNTNNGVLKLNPDTYEVLQFTKEDGLASFGYESNNYFFSKSGMIYYGSNNGINAFNPRQIIRNEHMPPVYVTGIFINQELRDYYPNDEPKEIRLHYMQKNIRFVFSSLDYSTPSKNKYRYMLENYDKGWINVSDDNGATYTNLNPGEYNFRVIGSNNHGLWNYTGDTMRVIIAPPWWSTTLARVGFLFFGIILFGGTQYILSARKSKINRYLARIVEEKTHALKEANKELVVLNREVQAQNEELVSNVEEISAQRDDIEQQHLTLLKLKRALDKVNKELRKANNSLEAKVKERTRHLEKANAELDRFVYSASHDLSAPLKSIRGLLYLDRIDPEINHDSYYRLISESIDKLESVIQSLLQFSRNANKAQVFETVELRKFLNDIVTDLKFLQPERNPEIVFEGPEELMVFTDSYRLRLVIGNLVSNAMKYVDPLKPANSVIIAFGATKKEYKISISDNGIGIEKEQMEKIFDMFYRATDKSTGSGLGLYIAKEAVFKMNGTLKVTSEPGVGSSFQVILPKVSSVIN